MSTLTLTTRERPNGLVITVSGEIDLGSRAALEEATRATPPAGAPLCLDMSEVTFMDSSGLNLLLFLHRRLAAAGSSLLLTGIQGGPMRLLTLTGADTILLPTDRATRIPAPRTTT